jgi:hypothetical protein
MLSSALQTPFGKRIIAASGMEDLMSKRTRLSALAIALVAATVLLATAIPAVSATRVRVYKGETSQAKPISLSILKTEAGQRFLRSFFVELTLTCEDATTLDFGMGILWGGHGPKLQDGVTLSYDQPAGTWYPSSEAIHLHGRIGQNRGSGTLKITDALLTADEQAQTCTTGDLTWTVAFDHTRSGTGSSALGTRLDGRIMVNVAADGTVSRSFTAA